MGRDLLGLILANALFLLLGSGLLAIAGWWRGPRGAVGSAGIAYLVGAGAFGLVAQILYVAGASMSASLIVLVCVVPACGILVGLRRRNGSHRTAVPSLMLVPVALMLGLLLLDLWFQPLWAFDAWTFWTPKAHALDALNGLDVKWFTSADMLGGARRDYPLLLPAVEAAGFRFSGYETQLLDVQSWIFLLAFVGVVYEAGAGRTRPLVLAAVLAMLVAAPSTASQLAAAEADIPMAAFFGAAGVCAVAWLETRRRSTLAICALLAASAAATKLEGAIFAGALFAALAVVSWMRGRRRDSLIAGAAFAGAIVVAVLPWRLWVALHGEQPTGKAPTLGPGWLLRHVDHVPYAAAYLLDKLLDPQGWLLIVPLWIVAAALAWRSQRRDFAAFAVITVALGFVGLVITYWATPLDLHFHLARSARRVVTGLVFFSAALTPLLNRESDPAATAVDDY
jgi:hypothetical protein